MQPFHALSYCGDWKATLATVNGKVIFYLTEHAGRLVDDRGLPRVKLAAGEVQIAPERDYTDFWGLDGYLSGQARLLRQLKHVTQAQATVGTAEASLPPVRSGRKRFRAETGKLQNRRERIRLVAQELSRRGYTASISEARGVDFLVSSNASDGGQSKPIRLIVTTTKGVSKRWLLHQKAEGLYADDLFYVFVAMNGGVAAPSFHIVPSGVVADSVQKGHAAWLKTPGKNGQAHNDNPMREFTDDGDRYLDSWELLGL